MREARECTRRCRCLIVLMMLTGRGIGRDLIVAAVMDVDAAAVCPLLAICTLRTKALGRSCPIIRVA